jgi:hypothetical protein
LGLSLQGPAKALRCPKVPAHYHLPSMCCDIVNL